MRSHQRREPASAGSVGPFRGMCRGMCRDVPFLSVSQGTSVRRDAAEISQAEGSGGRLGGGGSPGRSAGAGLRAGHGADSRSGGSCGAGALQAPQWSHPHRRPHHSRLALFSASSPDASEYPWQQVPSRHRRPPGTIYSPALPSAVTLAPRRGRGRLARPEHPTGHWLARPGHPRKAQGTAGTARVAVPVDFVDQLLPEWSAWAQGVLPPREGLAARDGGGIMAAPRVCVRLLPAGRGLARHRVGWWSRWVSWGCPGRGGHPQAQVGCMPGGGFAWSWSWFASPARHGGHQRCRRLLAATERCSRALATSSTAAAAGRATDRPRRHGLWPWAGGGCPGSARPRNPSPLPALRAGQCRQLPAMLCRAKHAGQTAAWHSRGGWWCSRRVTVFQHTVHSPKQMQIQVSQNRSSAKNNWEKMLKKSKYFF